MLPLAALAFALALGADCWTTARALKAGLHEGNAIMRRIFGERHVVLGAAIIGAVYLAFAVWAALVAQPPAYSIAVWTLAILAALHGVAAVRNYRKLKESK